MKSMAEWEQSRNKLHKKKQAIVEHFNKMHIKFGDEKK